MKKHPFLCARCDAIIDCLAQGKEPLPYPRENVENNIKTSRTRARKRGLPATLGIDDWRRAVIFFKDACAYCGDEWHVLEHATPVCRGGGTTPANCLPACANCNRRKGLKTLEELIDKSKDARQGARLRKALSWLERHGRTPTDPSGHTTLEKMMLVALLKREESGGSAEWEAPNVSVVFSLRARDLIKATPEAYWNVRLRWTIHLTEAGRLAASLPNCRC